MSVVRLKENIINFRPFALWAAALATGIACSRMFYFSDISPLFFLLIFPVCALIPLFTVNVKRGIVISSVAAVFFFIGIAAYFVQVRSFESFPLAEGRYILTGKIIYKSYGVDSFEYMAKALSADGKDVIFNFSFSCAKELFCGDNITTDCSITAANASENFYYFNSYMLEDIKYTAEIISSPEVTSHSFSLFGGIRESIHSALFSSMGEKEASVCYALVTGDVSEIPFVLINNIRYGGIAHIFAVSGLHIGIVYSGVSFAFKKLRLPRTVRSVLSVALCFFYSGICSFTPSSLRAVIMCAVGDMSFYLKSRRDLLESVGIAGIILLIYKSAYLFSVGFQMSFGACIGLGLFSSPFKELLNKLKIGGKISELLSVTVSVNIVLFHIMLDCFSYISVWGYVLNVVLVPVLSIAFVPLIVCILIACIIPFASTIILFVPKIMFSSLNFLFTYFDFTAAYLSGFTFGISLIPYYAVVFVASGKVNLRRGIKIFCLAFLVALTALSIIFNAL